MRPLIADGLKLLDPGPSLVRKGETAGQIVPILVEDAKQGREVKLLEGLEASLLDRSLLLEAEAAEHMLFPPVGGQERETGGQKPGQFWG
jgi:hypothetical protein